MTWRLVFMSVNEDFVRSWSTNHCTSSSRVSSGTTRFRKCSAWASAAVKGRQVSTSSLAIAGPSSRTSRGMPPQASGMPRSSSGIEKRALAAATRRSQAAASTSPPPTQWPWMRAMLIARRRSMASAICRPRSTTSASTSVRPAASSRSKPAQKARPSPETTTTLSPGCAFSQRAASASSRRVSGLRAFRRVERVSVRRPVAPSALTFRFSKVGIGCSFGSVLAEAAGSAAREA